MGYSIEQISPTEENANAILGMVRHDLITSGMPEADVERIVRDEERISRIQAKLANSADYMGALRDDGRLVGYSQSHEWLTGDQRPYAGPIEQAALSVHDFLHDHRLPGHPLGIFAVSVAAQLLPENEQVRVASDLIANVLERGQNTKMHNEARVGLADDEPLLPIFKAHGFVSTQQSGSPLGVPLRLYVAPLKKVHIK